MGRGNVSLFRVSPHRANAQNQADDGHKEPRVLVDSEDEPLRTLLETRICKEDGFQKQQETLIVWTEPQTGIDMALSFQEADGCAQIWCVPLIIKEVPS